MDWRECTDEREKYQLYLCSREWAEKRNAVKKRCGGICERCCIHPMYAVHHLSYLRKYDEPLDDLQGLCTFCHDFTHGKSDHDPLKVDLRRLVIYLVMDICDRIGQFKTGGDVSDAWFAVSEEIEKRLIVENGQRGLDPAIMPEYWAMNGSLDLNLPD